MAQYLESRIEDPIWLEPNDISFLRTRIAEEEAFVQSFQSQIGELRAQISELTLQKDAKLVEIASIQNVLSPVRRVPLEILSEIFELVLAKHYQWDSGNVSETFTLSSVCIAWRRAAHATPRLFSTLRISFENEVLGPELTWVEDWITLSQTVPLDLYLQFYVEEDDEFKDVLTQRGKKFLEYILTQFGPEVRSLNVMGLPSLFPILHLLPSSSLLSLEEISFHIINNDDDTIEDLVDIFPRKPEVFLGSSKLRKVEVNNVSFLEFLALPGEQLTSLKVGEDRFTFDPVMLLDMLPQFKQLVALEIVTPVDRFSGFSPDLSILLPTLKSLDVFFFNTVDNILRCITTPLLDRLSITYHRQDLDSLVMDMARFQQRSSTALSSLVFCLRSSAADERLDHTEKVIAVLSLFPAIRSLEIHTRALLNPDPLIQAMTCTEGHYVLPNLQDLVLERYLNYSDQPNEEDCRLSGSGFKSMVLSRWWPDDNGSVSFCNGLSRLQNVTLWGFHVDSEEDITHLSALSGLLLDYDPFFE